MSSIRVSNTVVIGNVPCGGSGNIQAGEDLG